MARALVVFVTCPNRRHAQRLARMLVRQRLAACVNIVPSVQSFFWWQGRVNRAQEALLIVKTTATRFEALRRSICAQHPYDVPEVIAVPIQKGHRPYLTWIEESVRGRARI